jgi:hypothetical protein
LARSPRRGQIAPCAASPGRSITSPPRQKYFGAELHHSSASKASRKRTISASAT